MNLKFSSNQNDSVCFCLILHVRGTLKAVSYTSAFSLTFQKDSALSSPWILQSDYLHIVLWEFFTLGVLLWLSRINRNFRGIFTDGNGWKQKCSTSKDEETRGGQVGKGCWFEAVVWAVMEFQWTTPHGLLTHKKVEYPKGEQWSWSNCIPLWYVRRCWLHKPIISYRELHCFWRKKKQIIVLSLSD